MPPEQAFNRGHYKLNARECAAIVDENNVVKRKRNVFPLSYSESICLMISSMFFLIPGYYALKRHLFFYFVTSTVTSIISVNYWRNAVPGLRKMLDLIVAKASFGIYFATGILKIRDMYTLLYAWPLCMAISLFYYLSNRSWDNNSGSWVIFHMIFHLCVALEQYVVLEASFKTQW